MMTKIKKIVKMSVSFKNSVYAPICYYYNVLTSFKFIIILQQIKS